MKPMFSNFLLGSSGAYGATIYFIMKPMFSNFLSSGAYGATIQRRKKDARGLQKNTFKN